METTSNPTTPKILTDAETLDPLSTWGTRRIRTRDMRPGMILVDQELGTPCAVLDHRIGNAGGGCVEWLIEDLDRGRYTRMAFAVSNVANVPVAAA